MNVSVVIPTRGNVDLRPIIDSFPDDWEIVIYDNGAGVVRVIDPAHSNGGRDTLTVTGRPDLAVYARYAAVEWASHDLVFTQDDDAIISDPQEIVDAWWHHFDESNDYDFLDYDPVADPFLVANMPQEFRHEGYIDSCLVGFGSCYHRDLPARAFERWYHKAPRAETSNLEMFHRTCDVVFTTLTPRVLVDVPKTDREFASDPDRMWKQPSHYGERVRMLEFARQVRDA